MKKKKPQKKTNINFTTKHIPDTSPEKKTAKEEIKYEEYMEEKE